MIFEEFSSLLSKHVNEMMDNNIYLFVTDTDRDVLWNLYLDSFPDGSNPIYRERRDHDCSCCRGFIKSFGNVVSIEDNKLVSVWDFEVGGKYKPVARAVSDYVKSKRVKDVFITKERAFGTDKTYELLGDGSVKTWHHFRVSLKNKFISKGCSTEGTLKSMARSIKDVFVRSLEEISPSSVETVLDLIAQNSLYKGEEWEGSLKEFSILQREYMGLSGEVEKDNYCWYKSMLIGGVIGKIRNHSIGVLLTDITEGLDLDNAVRKYESIVAPSNYKRPKAIFTKKMIEEAKATVLDLGYGDSLGRRFATIDDITVRDVLWSNKDVLKIEGDVFSELEGSVVVNPRTFERVEEVSIQTFMEDVLPRSSRCEVLFEGRHVPNLVSVIAPKVQGSPSMFKWNNGFSWAYNGNITDSMKQRVKSAGGNVEGVLRFSIQWNDNGDTVDDLDAHCIEPDMNHIYFPNRGIRHNSSGMLDVDIVHPLKSQVAVENITWTDKDRMMEGRYVFFVHNYTDRGGQSGFSAEIEYEGQVYSYEYNKSLCQNEKVVVAVVNFSHSDGLEFIESLPSSVSSKLVWGIKTNQFVPVSACMYSPNYWEGEKGIGHRHYFFLLKGCINDGTPNGFFNEFLQEGLMRHKRVFEALGSKMRVDPSGNQLSGLGFSSTKRDVIVCKLDGNLERKVKVLL